MEMPNKNGNFRCVLPPIYIEGDRGQELVMPNTKNLSIEELSKKIRNALGGEDIEP